MWPFSERFPERTAAEVGTPVVEEGDVPQTQAEHEYDYIIIGGGTAGCVLANRLSEPAGTRVLLLERGAYRVNMSDRIPLLSANFLRAGAPKALYPSPTPAALAPSESSLFEVATGKALGGTSKINSMLYTRGAVGEWNGWEEKGCEGWGYEEMERYFKKSERATGVLAERDWHGTEGFWSTRAFPDFILPHWKKTVDVCESLGLPFVQDANSRDHPAYMCAAMDMTRTPEGERSSTETAFLPLTLVKERMDRLKIATHVVVTRIALEQDKEGGQPRAVGVYFESDEEDNAGMTYFARAKREVVLSAGAMGSPKILQLSGIGPKSHLESLGIPLVKDLPGVGSNLQDHVGILTIYKIPIQDSLDRLIVNPLSAIPPLLEYIAFRSGLFLFPLTQLSIFARSSLLDENSRMVLSSPSQADCTKAANTPDIEIMPLPMTQTLEPLPQGWGGLTFLSCLSQPKSRGSVRLASANPRAPPAVDLGYFSHPDDWIVVRKALNLARTLGEGVRAADITYKMEPHRVLPPNASEEQLKQFVSETARTSYHYASTCRMAAEDDPEGPGVVDSRLRVHGVKGLRIADASIMPQVIATHTQAPTVCIAEKCADMILQGHN
ncbi:GMC oxidoreductase [Calocera cornea HHB12733]|uniref:GMC oxidoreductase n=1 Tax=Calocera cornea HHB12733 TaxID=1353952 RepID=A0A165J162_9BASI|nr:GMC oxidoreductase [Calocera cornea HHB12733]